MALGHRYVALGGCLSEHTLIVLIAKIMANGNMSTQQKRIALDRLAKFKRCLVYHVLIGQGVTW